MTRQEDKYALGIMLCGMLLVSVMAITLPKDERMPTRSDWHTTAKLPHPMDTPFVGYWVDGGVIETPLVLCLSTQPTVYFYYHGKPKELIIAFTDPPIQWVSAPGYDGD